VTGKRLRDFNRHHHHHHHHLPPWIVIVSWGVHEFLMARDVIKKVARQMLTFLRLQEKWLCFSIQYSLISEMALLFGRFPNLALCFLPVRERHAYGEKYGGLMKWYLQEQTEILGGNPVPVPLCRPQNSHCLGIETEPPR
jgi:hypothetical protein